MMFCKHVPLQSPLEFMSNAPSTLPTAHLFPGEVLRLQQHRVICSNKFTEPAVGALYLTNFRVIFSGNLITVSGPNAPTRVCFVYAIILNS